LDFEAVAAAILDLLPSPAFVAEVPSGRLLRWNRAAADRCGSDTLRSTTLGQLIHPMEEEGSVSAALVRAVREGLSVADLDATLQSATGPMPVTVSMQSLGAPADVTAVVVLCYERLRSAEAVRILHRNEERLAIALSAGRLGSWEFDLETQVLTSTAQCKANHGFAPDETMQLAHVVDAIHPEYRDRFRQAVQRAIETQDGFEIEVPNQWPDGSEHWLFVAGRTADPTCIVGVSQDVTDRRRIEAALRESEQQYRAIVDAANEGIWRLDQDARITFVNDRMAEMLAVAPGDMIGRHKWDFVFEEDIPAMRGLFERRKHGVSEEVADIRFRRGDGGEMWTLMAARPLYDVHGRFTGAVDLFTDITDRRRAEQELRDSDRRKDEFLAVVAHELRGPLAPILTAVKLLQAKGPGDPFLQRLRDTIFRQTMQLTTLVDDLLDVGRITAGKLRLDMQRVDLRDVARQAAEVSATLIERRKHTLHWHVPDAPVEVDGDRSRLVQIAGNLLSNAAKYTPDGGHIELVVFEDAGVGGIRILDHGVGIPPEMLGRIFDRFVQIGTGSPRTEGGLGIGLSVVKALVDLHGGSVEARSAGIGKGSEFTVRVPLAHVRASTADASR
jgi:PAS domain S-box-containing protein